jgi:aubergine
MEKIISYDSTLLESSNFFPKRSQFNTAGKKLNLAANYFKFDFLDVNKKTFFKYSVNFNPELPGDSVKLRATIVNKAKIEITKILGNYLFNNSTLFSLENYPDIIELGVNYNSQEYKINIKLTNVIDFNSCEAEAIYKKFFNLLLRKIRFVQIRRNYFNPSGARQLQSHKLEIWPGFNSSVNILNEGILLNMNILYKVLRNETALDLVKKIGQNFTRNSSDLKETFNDSFKGVAVLTRYNNDKVYIIDEVDLEKTPTSTFETKDGPISYLEYYKKKYGLKITVLDQPLLIHRDKKKNQEIHLIPEFCYLTGLTDEMRANFNLMKEMAMITKGNAAEKMEESRQLINQFLENKNCKEEINKWGLTISNSPLCLTGTKMQVGNCLMSKKQDGSRFSFNIDESNDIDRKIQAEMFSQPPLQSWAIFSTAKDEQLTNTFIDTIRQVQATFNYKMDKPEVCLVKSQNFRDWETELSRVLNPNIQAVVLIIPGSRGKGQLYNDLKRLLMGKYPIPSQIILSGTLAKGIINYIIYLI